MKTFHQKQQLYFCRAVQIPFAQESAANQTLALD